MKKKNLVSMLVLLLVSSFVFAQNPNNVKIDFNEDQLLLWIPADENALKVRLIDENQMELYAEKLYASDFRRTLDLSNLPSGVYHVEIDGKQRVLSQELIKSKQGLVLDNKAVVFKPKVIAFEENDKKVRLTFNNPTNIRSSVKVYDSKGNLITRMKNDENYFNKVLDFSQLPQGEYSIAVQKAGRDYLEKVYIGK